MLLDKASVPMKAGDFAHANLGWALMKLGRNAQAVVELRKATATHRIDSASCPQGNYSMIHHRGQAKLTQAYLFCQR
jgi:hypothetical protein